MLKYNAAEPSAEDLQRVKTEDLSDPFALDFFAQSIIEIEPLTDDDDGEIEAETVAESTPEETFRRFWHHDLPRVSPSEISRGNVFAQLPENLHKDILKIVAESLSQRLLNNQATAICEVVSTAETTFKAEATALNREQFVFLDFGIEPNKSLGVLTFDPVFAVKAIKKGFGYEINEEEKRELSKNELAVTEFFALGCLSDINKFFAQPVFRLRAAVQTVPDWLGAEQASGEQHGLLVKIKLELDGAATIARLFLPYNLIENLSVANNGLLAGSKRIGFKRFATNLSLRVVIGETDLNSGELAILEAGDTILLERPAVSFDQKALNGAVEVRIGSERAASLYGDLSTVKNLVFELREINQSFEPNEPDRLRMNEDSNENPNQNQSAETGGDYNSTDEADGNALALEKVTVTLRAEIAARRVSLDELAALRVNQIIDLGARATDPVELTIDGRTVAVGELVNIEDSLGVRLTRVVL